MLRQRCGKRIGRRGHHPRKLAEGKGKSSASHWRRRNIKRQRQPPVAQAGGGTAIAKAVAMGGVGRIAGALGAANATTCRRRDRKRRVGASAVDRRPDRADEPQSTALTSYSLVKVQSAAVAQVGSTATTNAIAQGGGSGQAFVNPGQTAYAFSTALDSTRPIPQP